MFHTTARQVSISVQHCGVKREILGLDGLPAARLGAFNLKGEKSQAHVRKKEFENLCVCAGASMHVHSAAASFKLTMWSQGFPFLTPSKIKATWSFNCVLYPLFLLTDLNPK